MEDEEEIVVIGYLWGLHTQCSKKCLKFIITAGYDIVDGYIPIDGLYSFPSCCPFLEYTIRIKRNGTYFKVYRIMDIKPREVKTEDIILYFHDSEKNKKVKVDTIISPENAPIEKIPKIQPTIYQSVKVLPNKITSLEQLDKLNTKKKTQLLSIVRASLQEPIFYELLRYFHENFLYNFGPHEMTIIKHLLVTKPNVLCFRDWVQTYLGNKKIQYFMQDNITSMVNYSSNPNMKRLMQSVQVINVFDMSKKQTLYCSLDYSDGINRKEEIKDSDTYTPNGSRLVTRGFPLHYEARFFPLSVDLVEHACNDFGIKNIDLSILRDALEIYLICESWRAKFGRTCFQYHHLTINKAGLEYIISNHFMTAIDSNSLNLIPSEDFHDGHYLAFPSDILKEIDFCEMLVNKVEDVKVYNSFSGRTDFMTNLQKRFVKQDTLIFANGKQMSHLISKKIGVNVYSYSMDSVQPSFGKNIKNIVLINSNKISMEEFISIFKKVIQKVTLHVIGDSNEYGVHPKKGLGEIFQAFQRVFPSEDFSFSTDTKIAQIHKNLLESSNTDILNIDFCNTMEESIEKITSIKSTKEDKNYILCSNEEDKKTLLTKIYESKSKVYIPLKFACGDDIIIHKNGNIATIKSARIYGTSGNLTQIQSKTNIPLDKGVYLLETESCIDRSTDQINTSTSNISHAAVLTIRELHGFPMNRCTFYIGERTRQKDILNAIKYCEKEFTIVSNYSNYLSAMNKKEQESITDLEKKIRLVWKK